MVYTDRKPHLTATQCTYRGRRPKIDDRAVRRELIVIMSRGTLPEMHTVRSP